MLITKTKTLIHYKKNEFLNKITYNLRTRLKKNQQKEKLL